MARSRSSPAPLLRQLAAAARPIYAVDDQRKFVYCNPACEAWLEVTAGELLGQQADYHSELVGSSRLQAVAAALCPPPQAFAGQRVTAAVLVSFADGRQSVRNAEFLPLSVRDAGGSGVLVLISDETPGKSEGSLPDGGDIPDWHVELRKLRQQLAGYFHPEQLLGNSPISRRLRAQVKCAITGAARVLVAGPPGSGREHIARTIHYGNRAEEAGLLLSHACAVAEPETLQSTLRALARQAREAEPQEPPTLLFSDVEELSAESQVELAAFLQLPHIDLRTIATARRPLIALAEEGSFRPDLAYMLSTLTIELPPLEQRGEDLPLFAQFFVEQFNARGGKQLAGFTPEALDILLGQRWPRNMDDLAAVVEASCLKAENAWIGVADLAPRLHLAVQTRAVRPDEKLKLDEFLLELERELIRRSLRRARGNKAKAARLLGIHRARLLRRITQLGLDRPASG